MIFPEVQWQDVGRTDEEEVGVQSLTRQIQLYMWPAMSREHSLFSKVSICAQLADMAGSSSPFCLVHLLPFFLLQRSSSGISLQQLFPIPAPRSSRQALTQLLAPPPSSTFRIQFLRLSTGQKSEQIKAALPEPTNSNTSSVWGWFGCCIGT